MDCQGCARAEIRPDGVYCDAYRQVRRSGCTAFYVPLAEHPQGHVISAAADLLQADIERAYYQKETPHHDWVVSQARYRVERALICRGIPIAGRLIEIYVRAALDRVSLLFPQLF